MQGASMFPHLKQLEVDFVVPRLVGDVPLCIDPFLLYKSRDPELRLLHDKLIRHFVEGMSALDAGDQAEAEHILTFPEVSEVGLGYGSKDTAGSGLGTILRRLLIDTLKASPAIMPTRYSSRRRNAVDFTWHRSPIELAISLPTF